MRAISLWQPWASAVALGAKRIETRHWSTSYRGPLVIHAAKRCNVYEMIDLHCSWTWCAILSPLGVRMGQRQELSHILPFGALVAVCDLVDCVPVGTLTLDDLDVIHYRPNTLDGWTERQLGDYSLGRYGWLLGNTRALPAPIPYRGRQAFFDVPDELVRDVTHGFPHGAPNECPSDAPGNQLSDDQLPLLGSNQDSSDPESDPPSPSEAARGASSVVEGRLADHKGARGPTEIHTVGGPA